MAILSLVFGIISLVCCIIFWFGGWALYVGLILGILGIIFGAISRKQLKAAEQPTGSATAGMVCSIIGTVLLGLFFIIAVACVASILSMV